MAKRPEFTVLVEITTTICFRVRADDEAAVRRELEGSSAGVLLKRTAWAASETDGERMVTPDSRLVSVDVKPWGGP